MTTDHPTPAERPTLTSGYVLAIEPEVRRAPNGYMALTPQNCLLRVGVRAATESEVRAKFAASMQRWARLADAPPRERTSA